MPIVIKELFVSDPLSEALEKINFNFDQIILAGGGPPGPIGPQGPAGVPGTKGDRGDHWQVGGASSGGYTGPTTDHGPYYGTLQSEDLWVDNFGTIWKWEEGPTNAWSNTGVNIKGVTGPPGPTGNSQDLVLYQGGSGVLGGQDSFSYLPETGPTTVNSTITDFYTLNNIDKNVLFLGDTTWARNLVNFSRYDAAGGPITTGSPRMVPKHTVIQSGIDYTGYGGLSIGAYGLTAGTGALANVSLFRGGTGNALPWPSVDANSFFNAGWRIKNDASILSHVFRMQSGRNDIEIQSGDPLALYGDQSNRKITLTSNLIEINGLNDSGDLTRFNTTSTSSRFRDMLYVSYNTSQLSTALSANNIVSRTPSGRLFVRGNSRIQGNLYVGDLTSNSWIDIGYNRTDDALAGINFYSSSTSPTVPEFNISRLPGINGDAIIQQFGAGSTLWIANYSDSSGTSSGNIILRGTYGAGSGFISFNNQVQEIARFDLANSRFGIGTTTPLAKFHIYAGSNAQTSPEEAIRIQGPNTPANANSAQDIKWQFTSAGSAIIRSYRGSSWDTYLQFLTNDSATGSNAPTTKLHIGHNGFVGIGTTTPGSKLEVLTNTNQANGIKLSRTGTIAPNTFHNNLEFFFANAPTVTTDTGNIIGSIDFRAQLTDIGDNDLNRYGRRIYVRASGMWGQVINQAPTDLIITNGDHVGANDGDIVINSNNNLGIGVAPGQYKLNVQGDTRINGGLFVGYIPNSITSADVLVNEGGDIKKRSISNLLNDLRAFPNKYTTDLRDDVLTSSDLNSFTDGTTYAQSGLGVLNLPEATGGWDVLSVRKQTLSGFQIASKATDTQALFYRRRSLGVFNSWSLIPRVSSTLSTANKVVRFTDVYGSINTGLISDDGYGVSIGSGVVPSQNLLTIYNPQMTSRGVSIGTYDIAPDNGLKLKGDVTLNYRSAGNLSFDFNGTIYANGPHLDFEIYNPTNTAVIRFFRKTNSPSTVSKGIVIHSADGTSNGSAAIMCGPQQTTYFGNALQKDVWGGVNGNAYYDGTVALIERVKMFRLDEVEYNAITTSAGNKDARSIWSVTNAGGNVWRFLRWADPSNTDTNGDADNEFPARKYDRMLISATIGAVRSELEFEFKDDAGNVTGWTPIVTAANGSTWTCPIPANRRFRLKVNGSTSSAGNRVQYVMFRLGV